MPVITIACSKGGVGKSTIATNLAVAMQQARLNVALLDCDSQRSTDEWADLRDDDDGLVNIFHAHKVGRINTTVSALSSNYDFLIIDTAGHDSSAEMRSAINLSDLVVVPLKASQHDLSVVSEMADLIDEIKVHNKQLKSLYVLNMVSPVRNSKKLKEVRAALDEFDDVDLFESQLHNRDAYIQSGSEGMGVTELKDAKAKREFDDFTKHVVNMFKAKKYGIKKNAGKRKKGKTKKTV